MSPARRQRHRPRGLVLVAVVIAAVTVAAVLGTGVAAADVQVTVVTVTPSTVAAGSAEVTLTFRVPSQANTAGMVGFRVNLPADHPFTHVTAGQLPGWTATPSTTSPATQATASTPPQPGTQVTWTAQPGTRIGPGGFADFTVSVGPVPPAGSVQFPATQTYDNGTVISWDEPLPASGAEPLHPVPTLLITDAGAAAVPAAMMPAGNGTAPSTSATVVLAVIGIVAGMAVVLVGVLAYRRRRAGPSAPAP